MTLFDYLFVFFIICIIVALVSWIIPEMLIRLSLMKEIRGKEA